MATLVKGHDSQDRASGPVAGVHLLVHLGCLRGEAAGRHRHPRSGLQQVSLTEKVDASLIGGFVLRVGDQQIDESVRGNLRRLRASLTDKTFTPSLN